MRPQPGGDANPPSSSAKPRSRKSSVDLHVPTTFVMKRVEDLGHASGTPQIPTSASRKRASTYGIQSLADTLEAAFGPDATSSIEEQEKKTPRSGSHSSSADSAPYTGNMDASAMRKLKRKLSARNAPVPATPLSTDAPVTLPTSAIASTPRSASMVSLKLSDEETALEDSASQAIASSGDEEEDGAAVQPFGPEAFPQLVMPSIQMPTRRPFTTRGKSMGKLKVMVAGRSGIGKSSLIRSIVQVCEDIVHVDPLSPSHSVPQPPPPKSKARKKAESLGTARILESYASTKPYPPWRADMEETRTLQRRKSSMDSVLERNMCFVDTPGFSEGPTEKANIDLVVNYVESLLHQTISMATLEDEDVLGVVSGNGGISVDVVLFLLPPDKDLTLDIDFMQRLSRLTNVIPIIARSDTISARETLQLKTSILSRLQTTSVRPFFFGKALDDALLAVQGLPIPEPSMPGGPIPESSQFPFSIPTHPYSISSTLGSDSENMDASLLMSPDYVQPLLPSELPALVNQVFDPESIAWLRHSAAKRFLAWRRKIKLSCDMTMPPSMPRPHTPTTSSVGLNTAINTSAGSSLFSAASPSGVLVPRSGSPFYTPHLQSPFLASSPSLALSEPHGVPTNFSLTRWTSQNQTDNHPSELRIAKWATDLQRSVRNERDRYEELQREDRAKWLLERVGEEVSKGTIVAISDGVPRAEWAVAKRTDEEKPTTKRGQRYADVRGLDSRDPLGLCNLTDEVKRQGFVLVKVLGGVSVLGAVVVVVVRVCDIDLSLPQDGWWVWLTGDWRG